MLHSWGGMQASRGHASPTGFAWLSLQMLATFLCWKCGFDLLVVEKKTQCEPHTQYQQSNKCCSCREHLTGILSQEKQVQKFQCDIQGVFPN